VGALLRLPVTYGAYALAAVLFAISFPVNPSQSFISLPRYVVVLFPLFMWLASWASSRNRQIAVGAVFATGLAASTALFATGRFVA
jgi:hypothetical protein